MTEGETKTRLLELEAPYRRYIWLDNVEFASGMELLRVTIREGRRITQLDLDKETASACVEAMSQWCAQGR